jgi:EpsI family protein
MNTARLWVVALLLAGTALLLQIRGNRDLIPASEPLTQVPNTILGYTGRDVPIDQETLDILGVGDILSRIYTRAGQAQPVGLLLAYYPTQRTGVTMHSPKHCLPGSGWVFESSRYVDLNDKNGKPHQVGEYVISNGDSRQFVIYWFQEQGRSIASEYLARVYLVSEAMRQNRTDGALVRVITPIGPGDDTSTARARAEAFTAQLAPILPRFIPD